MKATIQEQMVRILGSPNGFRRIRKLSDLRETRAAAALDALIVLMKAVCINLLCLAPLLGLALPGAAADGSVVSRMPTQVIIQAEHSGWGSTSSNLTLTLSNGSYVAGDWIVARPVISNLLAAARRPWPRAGTNKFPHFRIDPANLGLDAAWVRSNYAGLLQKYSGDFGRGPFPNASLRQRAWLTNALACLDVLQAALLGCYQGMWTDDYPSMEVRCEHDDGRDIEQLMLLKTRSQHLCMLPWEVNGGGEKSTSANAEISRLVAQLLPPGFLNRERLLGDLFGSIASQFLRAEEVNESIRKSTLEHTLGRDAEVRIQALGVRDILTSGGSFERFPDEFMATLQPTNWPERLIVPLRTGIENGVVTNLNRLLTNAVVRVDPLLKQQWLMARLKGQGNVTVEVQSEGSPDHEWLRGHMDKVGRAAFYDRVQPELRRSLGFIVREGFQRSSQWALLEDGRLLLYGFTGDGVLDWKLEELGFDGEKGMLPSFSINFVGVFVDAEGKIREMVPAKRE